MSRTTVLRELALLRALCASLRHSPSLRQRRHPAKLATRLNGKSMPSPPPARLSSETTDRVRGGPP